MEIVLKHAWNIAGKYALEPHGTVPRFLGTLGTVLSPGCGGCWIFTVVFLDLLAIILIFN